ncbi:MAG TPA: PilZ domain-containing protein [Candidatus Acidoferrales bacterium]|nr:PilZ domain-containing protein [Candidatus Acidoferrales bacterium]
MRTDPNTTSGDFTGTSERRAHPRCRPQPFAYVKVGEHNGGIVMDASETGLQIAAANSLAPENIVRLSLQLNPSAGPVEVEARVVWLSESKKTGGFEFVSLTDEARDQIRKWLSGDLAKARFSGPKVVPTPPARDQRMTGIRPDARANGAKSEIRTPEVSDHPPRGLEGMFPPEGEPIPPTPVHEAETHNGGTFGERVSAASRVLDPAPFRANPISDRRPNPSPFHEREASSPFLNGARFPARAIFSDSPFQAPPAPQRWSNARMGLLTGVVMVICFAVGMISGRVWMGRWPQGWNLQGLQELIGRASAPAAPAPANPTANPPTNPDATPAADGNAAAAQSSNPPAVTTPAAPESSGASSNAAAAPIPNPKEDTTAARAESRSAEFPSAESSPSEPAGSILVTAPAAGSPPTRVSLPQEPLTASASVAIGIRRSALLPPNPGPVSMHRPERLEFGRIIAPVPGALRPNIPQWGDPIVVLRVTVGEEGEIKSLVPIRGRDDLIPTAERLVREWQQFPARLDGQPIESTEEIILTFRTGP